MDILYKIFLDPFVQMGTAPDLLVQTLWDGLVAGVLYAIMAKGGSTSSLAIGGLLAGAICAFIGILISHLLGDVPASLLVLGTVSSAVTGAIGGVIGKFFAR